MPSTTISDLRRWLSRATFGVSHTLLAEANAMGWEKWVETQLTPNESADAECSKRLKDLRLKIEYEFEPPKEEGGEAKMMMKGKGKQKVKELRALTSLDQPIEKVFPLYNKGDVPYEEKNRPAEEVMMATMLRAVYSQWQVREVLADFWHNHFSVNSEKDESIALALPAYDREVIRANALGNFRTMLEGVATSAAMLYYLDGVESKASPANENFARELFELHTFGARHYLNHLHTKWRDVPGALEGKPQATSTKMCTRPRVPSQAGRWRMARTKMRARSARSRASSCCAKLRTIPIRSGCSPLNSIRNDLRWKTANVCSISSRGIQQQRSTSLKNYAAGSSAMNRQRRS